MFCYKRRFVAVCFVELASASLEALIDFTQTNVGSWYLETLAFPETKLNFSISLNVQDSEQKGVADKQPVTYRECPLKYDTDPSQSS